MSYNTSLKLLEREEGLLAFSEACEYLRMTESALYTAVNRREIPHYKIRGRLKFAKAELASWVEQFAVPVASGYSIAISGASHG